ncbi:unnamed protein product [Paramecium primaurelia]|uniref:Uncharacterized protein n=2 Tax=Paramecium TaxID=5884 RepID=A0A8S1K3F3_PARPR|nr:unnamed protein product [Paramecium primaurelia]
MELALQNKKIIKIKENEMQKVDFIQLIQLLKIMMASTQSQFNFIRKQIPKAPNSRQFSREKSQPMLNPITPTAKFRIHHNNQFLSREKMQKTSNNFFNNTAESTKITKAQNQSLLRKPEADYKQLIFDKEDLEEEQQFQVLCQTLDKIL